MALPHSRPLLRHQLTQMRYRSHEIDYHEVRDSLERLYDKFYECCAMHYLYVIS
jgi:regulator of replication initiation timing